MRTDPETNRPEEIERRSFEIIAAELGDRRFPEDEDPIIRRVIHATADFDYADNLVFAHGAVGVIREAIRRGATLVTDTQMGRAGINKKVLAAFGGKAVCYMSDPDVAEAAAREGTTRAAASMRKASSLKGPVIFVIGNAPTALLTLCDMMEEGSIRPAAVIGVPVGFVHVAEAKERILSSAVPSIVARGRKGGSNVAAAICNAILYGMDPSRGASTPPPPKEFPTDPSTR